MTKRLMKQKVVIQTDNGLPIDKCTDRYMFVDRLDWAELVYWMDRLDYLEEEYTVTKSENLYFLYVNNSAKFMRGDVEDSG